MKRVCFICVDGIGDVALEKYGYRTPLQAAATPNLDLLAEAGVNGLMDPVEPGLACGSDTAHMNMFGYDPRKYYRGRGAFESMGAGLSMEPGDIAFKSNFATMDKSTGIVTSRRADRNFEEIGPILCDYLSGIELPSFPNHKVEVKYATEHRCGVKVSGPGLSDAITGTDPLKDNLKLCDVKPLDDSPEAEMTARLVTELSQVISAALEKHEINKQRAEQGKAIANVVLLRGCGARLKLPTFQQTHGLHGFMIAPTCIIAGIGYTFGIDVVEVEGATGDYHTNVMKKAEAAVTTLSSTDKNYNFGFCHVKAVDDAGHDKNPDLKLQWLEKIDGMVGYIIAELQKEEKKTGIKYFVGITGDHSTVSVYGDHTSEPVPFCIAAVSDVIFDGEDGGGGKPGKRKRDNPCIAGDSVRAFDEISAAQGILGRFTGSDFMTIIKHCALGTAVF